MSDIRFNRWLHQSGTGGVYQDSSGNVGIGTSVPTGALSVVGVASATSFYGPLTGNVTGNVNAGVITATSSITVGDSFINSTSIGIGSTDTAGRNAGIGTAEGTIINNTTTKSIEVYGPQGWVTIKDFYSEIGLTATGGVINDYTTGSNVYRAHVFTSSGTFEVTELSTDYPNTIEYLVVAGGGGGSATNGISGGGGAGGLRTNLPGVVNAANSPLTISTPFPVSTTGGDGSGSYTVTVGAGGAGGAQLTTDDGWGSKGNNSYFGPPVSPQGITATGGGGVDLIVLPHMMVFLAVLGSGGAGNAGGAGGAGNEGGNIDGIPEGNPGGAGGANTFYGSGGGGGAGAAGSDHDGQPLTSATGGPGGAGVQVAIAGPAADTTGVGALNPGPGQYQWFAGGGGGGGYAAPTSGGVGGGGGTPSTQSSSGTPGLINTGGGGGAAASPYSSVGRGGEGGSGIVIVRYLIGSTQTGTAKATGGAISFADGKTFHVFNNSGSFDYTDSTPSTLDIVVVAGGGGGGQTGGGNGAGGGAGSYITGSLTAGQGFSVPITIGAGGAGGTASNIGSSGSPTTAAFPGHPVIANGGGGGDNGSDAGANGAAGGSGGGGGGNSPGTSGGAGQNPQPVPVSFTYYGNPGGDGSSATDGSAGGGGAGAAGNPGSNVAPRGYGGVGRKETWMPTIFGDAGYFSGGGAGVPAASGHPAEPGGLGGGGDSRSPGSPGGSTDGQMNTGGGAGGGGSPTTKRTGGSGIVIISYPT